MDAIDLARREADRRERYEAFMAYIYDEADEPRIESKNFDREEWQ